MSNADVIEQGIAALLASESDLSSVQRLYLGQPYDVPAQFWPWALIVIDSEESGDQMTGGRVVRAYSGAVVINVYHQDLPEAVSGADARIVRVPSYALLRGFMEAAIGALKSDAGQTLGGVVLSGGFIRRVAVGEEAVSYGLVADAERPDNLINYGVIPFTVETVEAF